MESVRSKWLVIMKHAYGGMQQERPPLDLLDIVLLFEEPDYDDGKEIRKRIRRKTVRAYYHENETQVVVRAVSRTTRDLS